MKILAIEHDVPGINQEDFQTYKKAEAARVYELYQAGIIRELYFRAEENTAVLVLECASLAEAEETVSSLPFVKAGLVTFELIPLAPYPGFARLFGN